MKIGSKKSSGSTNSSTFQVNMKNKEKKQKNPYNLTLSKQVTIDLKYEPFFTSGSKQIKSLPIWPLSHTHKQNNEEKTHGHN